MGNSLRSYQLAVLQRSRDGPNSQRKLYAIIHITVTFQPFLQVTISSILSCSQNIGPILPINLRKLTVVIGIERGSRVDNNWETFRGFSLDTFVGI